MSTESAQPTPQEFAPRNNFDQKALELLSNAGITINGPSAWDIQLLRPGVPQRAFSQGNLGLGEAYVEGAWEVKALDQFFHKLLSTRLTDNIKPLKLLIPALAARFLNLQSVGRSRQVGEQHYDLGNDFYSKMLDSRLTYTCGYWEHANTLEEAQEAKLELICRKLKLKPGMRILDIGCGWGSFMSYAAERYQVQAVGVSISKEQVRWAQERYSHLDLEFRLQDYRSLNEQFDAIVSVGMFEHVGRKNHRIFMEVAHRCLASEGLFLLHTTGKNHRNSSPDPWIDKYIFPNGDLPSIGQMGDAMDGLFVAEDLHNFGADYDKTLMAWHAKFEKAWPAFEGELGERFYRMWRYYLLSCAGAFRARDIQLWQWVLSKTGVAGGYRRPTLLA
ncbi:cyclopropane fatty acyl phospholipid synthase [Pseudomonas pudica]|uniref:Cyclopropane fatty acyl phospholipid synthase n=1 Tax=Pseudomonas pudica TaxID=272772 RepID=A0ABS0FUH8_9PSED|nr:cyclopropane fatty acyl phospholipid synthase [Pseudomonas pudica]MBF8643987.1 cyclopropane fatty acyl phospholipid synthase [Pseudomonas pudica]MBF8758646.1 cyclopropane fatty acyl phospholipid synthase [Pseudomonas pudica]